MSHYLVAQIEIADREQYRDYEAGFVEVFAKYKGKMLAVDEQPDLLEGNWSFTRTVLIEFPSSEAALDWYRSAEYQDLAKHRFASSSANIVLIEGFDLPVGTTTG